MDLSVHGIAGLPCYQAVPDYPASQLGSDHSNSVPGQNLYYGSLDRIYPKCRGFCLAPGKGYILSSTTAGSEDLTSMHSAIWLTRSGLSPPQIKDPMWLITDTIIYCAWSTPKSHLLPPPFREIHFQAPVHFQDRLTAETQRAVSLPARPASASNFPQ